MLRFRFALVFAGVALGIASACSGPDRNFGADGADGATDVRGTGDGTLDVGDARSACTTDFMCDDRIACTVDHCRDGVCSHDPCPDCCAGGMQCIAGYGCGRAPTPCTMDSECMDAIRCTIDRCRDGRFCEHVSQDGLCATGEICLAALGCIPRPPDRCSADRDCTMNPCLGTWYCDNELGCQFRSLTNCDDGMACTTDTCDNAMGGCRHTPRDNDMDGHADPMCGGDDCDDANAARHPGATEICANGVDENCNMRIDEGCCTPGGTCTTTCGSAGTTTCASGMPGPCMAPTETCNGRDDDCDGMVDNGFACARGAVSMCTTTCGSMNVRTCNPDCTVSPCPIPPETCNGRDDDCDGMVDNGFACPAGSRGSCPTTCGSTGSRTCLGSCAWDACVPPAETCNGVDDNCNAACDEGFTCCARSTRDCTALGFVSGTATCRGDCGGWDTVGCSNCGNRVRDTGEPCDGTDVGTATCPSLGFGGGTLRCTAACTYDTTGCSPCGNARIDPGEQCDTTNLAGQTCASLAMGFTGGTLRCGPLCTFDTTMCTRPFNPTGTWLVSPGVNLYCAFGAVSISFGNLTFTDTGSGLSVSGGGINCMMTGASARVTRMVNVSCMLLGGCNETYALTGTFTDDTHFTGTFTATYSGAGCFGCATRSFPVSGSR